MSSVVCVCVYNSMLLLLFVAVHHCIEYSPQSINITHAAHHRHCDMLCICKYVEVCSGMWLFTEDVGKNSLLCK